jgi:hypothetical protein
MELTNQFVSAEINKNCSNCSKTVGNLLCCGHTAWINSFYNSPVLAEFMKSKKWTLFELYVLMGKMFLLWRRIRN